MRPRTLRPVAPAAPAAVRAPRRTGNLAGLIGHTPLVHLARLGDPRPGVEVYAKLESQNPGGSVKDRAAKAMLDQAEAEGRLRAGVAVLDATSGNTGIALAMLAAARGIEVTLCLPANASVERQRLLRVYGARVVLTDPLEGSDGAIREARRLAEESPGRYLYLDQYSNPANWKAHYHGTGPEIWQQTAGRVTHFVAGLGTTGTFMGVGRYLKERNPAVRLVALQPDSPFHGLEGLKHMDSALVPAIYDPALPDEQVTCATEEAYEWTRRLARKEGLLVGISSGANFAAARRVAEEIEQGVVVTVFCDAGDRYLSERFWDTDLC